MMDIDYTVKRVHKSKPAAVGALGATYVLTVKNLPGRRWKYGYAEMQKELVVLLGISFAEARNILFDAYLRG